MVFGAHPKPFAFADVLSGHVAIGGLRIAVPQLVNLALTALAPGELTLSLKHTSIGVQLRAASQDFRTARIAFVATILGGLGSLARAVAGGFLVSVLTVLLDAVLSAELRGFKEAFPFGLVFVILRSRPQGLIAVVALKERV